MENGTMRLKGLLLGVTLAMLPGAALATLPEAPPVDTRAQASGIIDAGYWYHHRYYPYRWHGTYYRYHWRGGYYNRRYRCGPHWCYRP